MAGFSPRVGERIWLVPRHVYLDTVVNRVIRAWLRQRPAKYFSLGATCRERVFVDFYVLGTCGFAKRTGPAGNPPLTFARYTSQLCGLESCGAARSFFRPGAQFEGIPCAYQSLRADNTRYCPSRSPVHHTRCTRVTVALRSTLRAVYFPVGVPLSISVFAPPPRFF